MLVNLRLCTDWGGQHAITPFQPSQGTTQRVSGKRINRAVVTDELIIQGMT
jgi:hypothetical protein